MTKNSRAASGWTRWGLLVTTLAMAGALLLTTWASYRGVRRASWSMARAHGEFLGREVERVVRGGGEPPRQVALEEILVEGEAAGLRYVAIIGPRGRVLAEAGARVGPSGLGGELRGPPRLETFGRVYRLTSRLPPPRGGEPGDGARPRRDNRSPPPGDRPPGRPTPPPRAAPSVVIEYQATSVEELNRNTQRTLFVAVACALMLTMAAIAFWRREQQREISARQREQQKRLGSLGEMAAVMAHEIRNPLASLKGNAQLLAEQLDAAAPAGRKAARIISEATRLEELLANLLDFSRSGPLERSATDPALLLRESAAEVGSEVVLDAGGAPESWSLDAARMRQVLTNLLRNAVQASPPGGEVGARLGVEGGRLVIWVRDSGDGIEPGMEEEIFEPFITTRSSGTGLGLAVSRRIVEMHGGILVARNRPGGGAEFVAQIPAG